MVSCNHGRTLKCIVHRYRGHNSVCVDNWYIYANKGIYVILYDVLCYVLQVEKSLSAFIKYTFV